MTDKEKDQYKIIANKLNQDRQSQNSSKQIANLHDNSYDYWMMKDYLKKMFEFIPNHTGKNNINLIIKFSK